MALKNANDYAWSVQNNFHIINGQSIIKTSRDSCNLKSQRGDIMKMCPLILLNSAGRN